MRACMRPPRKLCKKMCENYIWRFQSLLRHACMLIQTRIHKHMHVLQGDAISFTSINALYHRSKLKGECVQVLKVDAAHQ